MFRLLDKGDRDIAAGPVEEVHEEGVCETGVEDTGLAMTEGRERGGWEDETVECEGLHRIDPCVAHKHKVSDGIPVLRRRDKKKQTKSGTKRFREGKDKEMFRKKNKKNPPLLLGQSNNVCASLHK